MDQKEIEKRFTYHPPEGSQAQRYEYIRSWAKWLALHICEMTPASREQSLAITALEECVMWSNAAIARNEGPDIPGESNMQPYRLTSEKQARTYSLEEFGQLPEEEKARIKPSQILLP